MPHRIDHFMRTTSLSKSKRWFDSDPFIGFSLLLWLIGVVSIVIGLVFWVNWWCFLGTVPGLITIVLMVLSETHEANVLSDSDREIYLSYRRLSETSRKNLPQLSGEALDDFTVEQKNILRKELSALHDAEEKLREHEREMNPAARQLIEALQTQKNLTLDKVEIVKELKELM